MTKGSDSELLPDGRNLLRSQPVLSICSAFVACVGFVSLLGWALDVRVLASLGSGNVPVAPTTAVMFVLYAGALFLRVYLPDSRASYQAHLFVIAAGALIATVLLILSLLGIRLEAERLGFFAVNKPGELQVGHMLPVTAFCFLLSSLSYMLSLRWSRHRRLAARFWTVKRDNTVSIIQYPLQ